ncbi:MAG: hypothetical protein COA99_18900 [Moraxellaceae bacterium]|nr:MAG: hypothetical protein COA99_18900 [Moraxellaceae bacterium]
MKQGSEEILSESTPVIDLRKNGLPESFDAGANDPTQNWDNDKTEVYFDSDDDQGSASLTDAEGESHPITAFPFIMGRGTECDLVLTGKGLSRKHIEIIFQSGRFVVNDLESLNGLKVNGYKVSRVILEEGDEIKLGESSLTFSSGVSESKSDAEPALEEITDNTFGSDSATKIKRLAAMACSVALILGGGVYAYKSMSSGQQIAPVARVTPSNAAPSNNIAPPRQVVGQSSALQQPIQQKQIVFTPPVSSPPPSLSLKPQVRTNRSFTGSSNPALAKLTSSKNSKSVRSAKRLLKKANARYLDGDVVALFKEMKVLENDSRLPSGLADDVRAKHQSLASIYTDYSKGQKAFAQNNVDGAFNYWTRFLEKESRKFKSTRSVYADQVVVKVVDEYVTRGNKASQAGEHHKAYKMWKKASKLGDSVAAKIAIDSVNAKSKQLYRKALRLEYVNSAKAKSLWQQVVTLVPPGTEYYTKASSKLAWYDRWGG